VVEHGLITGGVAARSVVKPLVDDAITTILITCPGASMLFYRAALPLSAQTLSYVAGVIRRHRAKIGSCWRKLNAGRQALLVLVHLRKGETFADLAAGFAVGTATAWRYARETITLLAARAPKLRSALAAAKKAGHAFVVIDGTLIPIDRVAADRPFYSGKHRRHGMNLQVIASPAGEILWVSGPLPGAVHDLTAARIWGIIRELADAGLIVLADKGYIGAGEHVRTPYRGRNKPASQKAANSAHAKLRAPGERANAQLKHWSILRKLRCCPWRAGQIAKAIHALQARDIAG
jgi:DDE superfamily endonuclease/Helix-turn-helix of DDE superfamily endonuclease